MRKFGNRKKTTASILIIFSLLLAGTLLAQTNRFSVTSLINLLTEPTPTPQPSRPKRTPPKSNDTSSSKTRSDNSLTAAADQPVLASADFNLLGLGVTASPANQTVPKNVPTQILTDLQVPDGQDSAQIITQLNPKFKVRGELVGPSFGSPQMLETAIGQPLNLPAMAVAGNHVVQNLRVVDTGTAGEPTVSPVNPDSCGINVIDQLLVSQVQVNELTYDQIIQSGIGLTDANYTFFNFVLGIATASGIVPISIPVALPNTGAQLPPIMGNPGTPSVNGVAVPDIAPVMLQGVGEDGGPQKIDLPGGGGELKIPGAIVFPGRVGLLHQFFEAIVIVSNGAPNGTPLVITNLKAKANLPDGGTANDPADDPLRIAAMQNGGQISELPLHGLGADNKYGTSDDSINFAAGQSGQGTFLLEGLKEGTHQINFTLEGTLTGLPGGPIQVRGNVPGVVVVKDSAFSVTFTHPSVVRAGQEYDLGMTFYNSGSRNLQNVIARLNSNSVSGAELIDSEQKSITDTIEPGSSGTIRWHLRSQTTGQVTATYTKVGEDIKSGIILKTGVGDRNVPLSPDSLILPDAVGKLPPNIAEAARQLLGQAWSVANAPAGSLPPGVINIPKQTVVDKAVELSVAGLRVDFGEAADTSLKTLMRDWLGEEKSSTGFADALKDTPAGYYFYDSVGTNFYQMAENGQTADGFNQQLSDAESPRSGFISALISQSNGQPMFGAKLVSPENKATGWGENSSTRFGEMRNAFGLNLLESDPHSPTNQTRGQFLLASKPVAGNWHLDLTGWRNGTADISLLVPTSGKNYRQIVFSQLTFSPGKQYRLTFKSTGTAAPVFEEKIGETFQPVSGINPIISQYTEPAPRIVGTIQVTPEVVAGGDQFGRLVGVLFSKPMVKDSVENKSRYQISGGNLIGGNSTQSVGKPISVTDARQNFGNRFVILGLETPVGPFIERNLNLSGIVDTSGKLLPSSVKNIEMRVSPQGNPPGAYLTGRVLNADGSPVANALANFSVLKRTPEGYCDRYPTVIASRTTDSNGEYEYDYVRETSCSPVYIDVFSVAKHSTKSLVRNILYHGQHLIFDAVFLARGNVRGTVTNYGNPVPNAFVSITPELDVLNSKLVRTDSAGNYQASDVPVGNISVKAVGTGIYALASGLAAGTVEGSGQTAVINVTTQAINGRVSGKVINSDAAQTPVNGALVVARAYIPGFSGSDPIPVGYSFTNQEGKFDISNLPVGNISLSVQDPNNNTYASTTAQLTVGQPTAENILIAMPGFGSVSGRVTNETGQPINGAGVYASGGSVTTDALGRYTIPRLRAGSVTISAADPVTKMTGGAETSIQDGENKTDVDIVIKRPATLKGQVFISENGTIKPLAEAKVAISQNSTLGGPSIKTTDSLGRYEFTNIQPGQDLIRFVYIKRKLFINTATFYNSGETVIRNAVFAPGKIHGKVTQPDGGSVVAQVTLRVPIADLSEASFGFPKEDANIQVLTDTNGNYSVPDINPGKYTISTSNSFFPINVSKSGTLPNGGDHEVNLTLVSTLAGKIQGTIYQPDGITPVGAGVRVGLGGGSLADIFAKTNAEGHYEFAEVFSEGSYTLTANDPLTGLTNRTFLSVRQNQELTANLRLLGRGSLKIKVIDGAGNPVPSGSLNIQGGDYPNDGRTAEIIPSAGGTIQFNNLNEGTYAVSAAYTYLGGRASAEVTIGGLTEITVQVQSAGKVTGRVLMPDGITPVGLADVTLLANGRVVGIITSLDTEEERGKFEFDNVIEGDFRVDVFDNRSGRSGRTFGRITQQNQTVDAKVRLLARGAVVGKVTANGNPVDHAVVNLSADGSGISGTNVIANTDEQGNYRFSGIPVGRIHVSVSNGPGGLGGEADAAITGTSEPLPDKIVNVVLTPTVSIKGKIYKNNAADIYAGAQVTLSNGFTTTSNENGLYQFNFVPMTGVYRVSAKAPSGYDRGVSEQIAPTQAGSVLTADVTMKGLGNISGTALDNNNVPLNHGTVAFSSLETDSNVMIYASVQPDGRYRINKGKR